MTFLLTQPNLNIHDIWDETSVGNPKFLHPMALDLVGCRQLSLGLLRFNAMEKHDIKTKNIIDLENMETIPTI